LSVAKKTEGTGARGLAVQPSMPARADEVIE
jgi:hypothetical protein